jgi:hypothetical protein
MNNTHRPTASSEASTDLSKDPKTLLDDIHDELLRTDRKPEVNQLHANKRIASMQVKVSLDMLRLLEAELEVSRYSKDLLSSLQAYADKTERRIASNEAAIASLNRWMLSLTLIGLVFAGLQAWFAWRADEYAHREPPVLKAEQPKD